MRTSFAHIHAGQKFLLENVAAAFSKEVARGSITKINGLIISWGSSRMICCDWNHVWRAWASAGCVTATKARKIYLHCLLSTQMIGSDTLPRHKQWRNALGFCVLSDREGGMLTTLYKPMHQRSNKICPENPFTKANQSCKRTKFVKFYINIDLNVSTHWRSSQECGPPAGHSCQERLCARTVTIILSGIINPQYHKYQYLKEYLY